VAERMNSATNFRRLDEVQLASWLEEYSLSGALRQERARGPSVMRLYVLVEGQTEEEFVKSVLVPHLWRRRIEVRVSVVETSRDAFGRKTARRRA